MSTHTQKSQPLVIGLTGGIGSGKSAATKVFEELGIEIVDADVLSRVVVEPGTDALAAIGEHFSRNVINSDGTLNRAALRELIFTDPTNKSWLENLLHPLIRNETERRLSQAESPYVILSSPLLFETNQAALSERVLLIDAPEITQLSRASARDGVSPESVSTIMRSQLSRAERLERADDIITNDKDLQHLEESVKSIHEEYLRLAKERSQ